jgi:hypothetical protein
MFSLMIQMMKKIKINVSIEILSWCFPLGNNSMFVDKFIRLTTRTGLNIGSEELGLLDPSKTEWCAYSLVVYNIGTVYVHNHINQYNILLS